MLSCSLIIMAVVLTHAVAWGDEKSHRKAAENLLIVTNVDKSLPKIVEQVLASQLQQNPQLTPYRDVMQRFLNKYMHWESLKEDVMTAYTQEFTEPELKQLTAFYKTPLGQKAVEKMPQLLFIGGQIGMRRVQANEAELRQMIEAEGKKAVTAWRRLTLYPPLFSIDPLRRRMLLDQCVRPLSDTWSPTDGAVRQRYARLVRLPVSVCRLYTQ